MARVTITFEDIESGPHDGGVTMGVAFEPSLPDVMLEELSCAQIQALSAVLHIQERFTPLTELQPADE